MDELEAGIERLIAAYTRLKDENHRLRERLVALESRDEQVRERLDRVLARLAGVEVP